MINKKFKRYITIASALCMSLVMVLPMFNSYATEIINPNPKVDIIVNTCSDYSGTYEDFKNALIEELETCYDTNGADINISDTRISKGGIQVDTLDLSDWYVYDHYGNSSNTYLSSAPSDWNDYSGRRPYCSYVTRSDNIFINNVNVALSKLGRGITSNSAYLFSM